MAKELASCMAFSVGDSHAGNRQPNPQETPDELNIIPRKLYRDPHPERPHERLTGYPNYHELIV